MKRFVSNFSRFAAIVGIVLPVPVIWRVIYWQPRVEASLWVEPWQRVLFIGDSHIGCTFVEDPKYENRIIWEASMPQQFTTMRLREMEKRGSLKGVEVLVLDFGLQSIGQQRRERMKEFWWRMLPISYKHCDLLPLSWCDFLSQFVSPPSCRIHIIEDMPTANISILSRSRDEKEEEFEKTAEMHFRWTDHPELMCTRWEESLKAAVCEIQDICKRNNIKLLFFTAPLTSYYNDSIPQRVEEKLQEFVGFIKELGVPYYDLRRWGRDDDFRDCFHFRLDGAIKFTEWFYREVIDSIRTQPY